MKEDFSLSRFPRGKSVRLSREEKRKNKRERRERETKKRRWRRARRSQRECVCVREREMTGSKVVAVITTGGCEGALFPLSSPGSGGEGVVEEALIPLANEPLLLFPLLRLEELFGTGGMRQVAICIGTEEGSVKHWIDRRYQSSASRPHVVTINETHEREDDAANVNERTQNQKSTAQVVAQVFHQGLGSEFDSAETVIVMPGNLVSDVQLEAVVAAHSLRNATATVMLARPRDGPLSSSKKGATTPVPSKTKSKAPKTFVGLDGAKEQLCFWMSEKNSKILPNGKRQQLRQLQLPIRVLKKIPNVNITSDFIDTDVAVFNREVFDERLSLQGLESVSGDLVPYLVKQQFHDDPNEESQFNEQAKISGEDQAGLDADGDGVKAGMVAAEDDGGNSDDDVEELDAKQSKENGNASGELSFEKIQELIAEMSHGDFDKSIKENKKKKKCFCSVYIVPPDRYCAKADTIETYGEISKDLTSVEFSHMLPPGDLIGQPSEKGSKTTVGAGCLFGDNVKIGDKCSVKRSILGAKCIIGNNVKIVNSVIMDDTKIGDGSHIQNCVICKHVQVGEKCTLKDCNVGAQWAVEDEMEHRGETLAHSATPYF